MRWARRTAPAGLLAAALGLTAGKAHALGWTSEVVDSPPDHDAGLESSIAFDSAGRPHIAYSERIDGNLKYAHKNAGNVWVVETVDSAGLAGSGVSLALDASGMAHISYHRSADSVSTGDVRYAERHCFFGDFFCSWAITTLATGTHSPFAVGNTGIAIDGAGNIHVTFVDNATSELRYTKHDSTGWWTPMAVTPLGSGTTSIAVDSNDLPHITFSDQNAGTQGYVHVACVFILCGFSFEPIDHGDHGVIRLDGAGHAHVAYSNNSDVKYAHRACDPNATGCTWTTQTVFAGAGQLAGPSLAVTAGGVPHISFYRTVAAEVRYAHHTFFGWTNERADILGSGFGTTAIALDTAGNPNISYHDSFNNDLRHAVGAPAPLPVLGTFEAAPATAVLSF
ncbi:MAG TPA: hypothetical protein VH374_23560 [Polyangia bacterium]|jgi:hypothetical protein|nr:hypothetical protein [Polyangia bacterium]